MLMLKNYRSGRTLLTFKMTDYTSSILVKMFSRDKEDAALYQHVKKGMWVKVRGSIQNDTFVRDLIMIGNDINEIRQPGRKDKASEDNKRVELASSYPNESDGCGDSCFCTRYPGRKMGT